LELFVLEEICVQEKVNTSRQQAPEKDETTLSQFMVFKGGVRKVEEV